jgi:hypothetical protein
MQGASAYPMSRGQDGDNMGWHQNNHFYGLQIEGFPPAPWVSLDHDSQSTEFKSTENRSTCNLIMLQLDILYLLFS